MVNNDKLNSAASQAKEQASELAAQVKGKADQLIAKATPAVSEATEKLSGYASKAGVAVAGRLDGVTANLKSATSGKGGDKIDAVSAKLKKMLDPQTQKDTPPATEGEPTEQPPTA